MTSLAAYIMEGGDLIVTHCTDDEVMCETKSFFIEYGLSFDGEIEMTGPRTLDEVAKEHGYGFWIGEVTVLPDPSEEIAEDHLHQLWEIRWRRPTDLEMGLILAGRSPWKHRDAAMRKEISRKVK